jgi:regulator of sigma E protease
VISALPLGGYVRMAGMEDAAALEGGEEEERPRFHRRDYDAKPLWARIWVVSAGVMMNFLFAIVVFAGLAFFYGDRLLNTTRVEVIPQPLWKTSIPSELAAIPRGAELSRVGGTPVSTWNDVAARFAEAPAGPLTLEFTDAQPVTLLLPSSDSARLALLQHVDAFVPAVIGQVSPGSAAERAGLRTGDHVVGAAGEPIRPGVSLSRWCRRTRIRSSRSPLCVTAPPFH